LKSVKIALAVLLTYVAVVVVFESLLGHYQPENDGTLIITTTDQDGHAKDRVLAKIDYQGGLYVAANHWPRAWYRDVLRSPQVQVAVASERQAYQAVPVEGEEHSHLDKARPLGLVIRFLTGFPPRYFVKLVPED
jgi:hypothetical protein